MVAEGEAYLRELGFRDLRVRFHESIARIEVPAAEFGRLLEDGVRESLIARFREIGFHFVTLDLQKKIGKKEMKNIPYGAIAFYTMADKLAAGLQQLMAGARKFSLNEISRADLFSGNRETERETGIPHVSDINDEVAKKILNA